MERVIIITHEYFPFPGGIAHYVREMARALAAEGRQVEVWCPSYSGGDAPAPGCVIVPIPRNRGTQGWRCRCATARLWRQRAGVVRDATVWLAEPGAVLTACYGFFLRLPPPRRLIVTLHGSEILNFTRMPHRRVLLNRLLARASVASVVSRFARELLLERTTVAAGKVRVIPGALRAELAPRPAADDSLAPPPEDGLTVLCVARIHPRKGQRVLLEAAAALPLGLKERTTIRFVGRGVRPRYRAGLEQFALANRLRVDFAGEKQGEELRRAYATGTIFAMTSLFMPRSFESFGMVYLEASAHGLPVLAHDTGGVRDAVIDGGTGLLVAPGDRRALEVALRRLLESPGLRRRLGEAGRRHAQQFSWAKNAAALLAP
ncbi:MAG: glycosyltransferase family 4 protein [Puniceicoccales bacterium]|jgi:phosphatidylinositol alpha-1,6-mannosyltransferase|nr:glycosyltransferase family 4 protein [Puniceicoccales bacterium]